MRTLTLTLTLTLLSVATFVVAQDRVLSIGGLFNMDNTGWPIGHEVWPGAQAAVDLVNSDAGVSFVCVNSSSSDPFDGECEFGVDASTDGAHTLLRFPDTRNALHHLRLLWEDDQCDTNVGLERFRALSGRFELQGAEPPVAFVGPGCSRVSLNVGSLANAWRTPLLSWGSTSPELTDKADSHFSRLVYADTFVSAAWFNLLRSAGWTTWASIYQLDSLQPGVFARLEEQEASLRAQCEREGNRESCRVESLAEITVADQLSATSLTQMVENVRQLKSSGARVLFGAMSLEHARLLWHAVLIEGMHGADFQWIASDTWGGLAAFYTFSTTSTLEHCANNACDGFPEYTGEQFRQALAGTLVLLAANAPLDCTDTTPQCTLVQRYRSAYDTVMHSDAVATHEAELRARGSAVRYPPCHAQAGVVCEPTQLYSSYAFDAVLVAALAVHRQITKLVDENGSREAKRFVVDSNFTDGVNSFVRASRVSGITARIAFADDGASGDRLDSRYGWLSLQLGASVDADSWTNWGEYESTRACGSYDPARVSWPPGDASYPSECVPEAAADSPLCDTVQTEMCGFPPLSLAATSVAFVYFDPIADLAYSFRHDSARVILQERYPRNVDTSYFQVPDAIVALAERRDAVDEYCTALIDALVDEFTLLDAVDVELRRARVETVVLTSPLSSVCLERIYSASEFPASMQWVQIDDGVVQFSDDDSSDVDNNNNNNNTQPDNVLLLRPRLHLAAYVAGQLAGTATRTGKIGVIATSRTDHTVLQAVNAFALGVHHWEDTELETRRNQVRIIYTNATQGSELTQKVYADLLQRWLDEDTTSNYTSIAEASAASTGTRNDPLPDVIFTTFSDVAFPTYVVRDAPHTAALIGWNADMRNFAGERVWTSVLYDWVNEYEQIFFNLFADEKVTQRGKVLYPGTLSKTAVLASLSDDVRTQETSELVLSMQDRMSEWEENEEASNAASPNARRDFVFCANGLYFQYSGRRSLDDWVTDEKLLASDQCWSNGDVVRAFRTAAQNASGVVNIEALYDNAVPDTAGMLLWDEQTCRGSSQNTPCTDEDKLAMLDHFGTSVLPRPTIDEISSSSAEGIAFIVIASVFCAASLIILLFLLAQGSDDRVAKAGEAPYIVSVFFGSAIGLASIIPWFVVPSEVVCAMRLWLFVIGFGLVSYPLYLKMFLVARSVLDSGSSTEAPVTPITVLAPYLGVVLGVDIIVLIVWQVHDPLQYTVNEDLVAVCDGNDAVIFLGFLCAWHLLFIVASIIIAIKERKNVHGNAKYAAFALYNTTILSAIVVAVAAALQQSSTGQSVLIGAVLLVLFLMTEVCISLPIMLAFGKEDAYGDDEDMQTQGATT